MRQKIVIKRAAAALSAAFPLTLPVLAGFFILGIAYGFLMRAIGLGVGITFLTSLFVFAGSLQYMAVTLFTAAFSPVTALAVALMVNARHIFYGISMLGKLNGTGRLKPYIIFALCDETFSILSSNDVPEGIDRGLFMFFVAFLNRWYWIASSALGALLGGYVSFDIEGLDFALTAMFVVIFLNQWTKRENRFASIAGVVSSVICLLAFGAERFIIPAMILILAVLAVSTKMLSDKGAAP